MKELQSFTAIDFETMTANFTSACAVGLVKVRDGVIVKKFYSLINPVSDAAGHVNSDIHGITPEMAAKAPTFDQLWQEISDMIDGDTLVCHNADFDESVLLSLLDHYGIRPTFPLRFICTYQLTGLSLLDFCKANGIAIGVHHDALDDATACAQVFLSLSGLIRTNTFRGGIATVMEQSEAKKYDKSTLKPLDENEVENKATPFFKARTVITGVFEAFPNRNELGLMLKNLGADINTSISKKTQIVVMGDGAGPAKIKKIEELRASGIDIRIIFEPELISILG